MSRSRMQRLIVSMEAMLAGAGRASRLPWPAAPRAGRAPPPAAFSPPPLAAFAGQREPHDVAGGAGMIEIHQVAARALVQAVVGQLRASMLLARRPHVKPFTAERPVHRSRAR